MDPRVKPAGDGRETLRARWLKPAVPDAAQHERSERYCRGSRWRASAITRGIASSFAGAIT